MGNLDISITSPTGSPFIHITVKGKGQVFSHTEVFHPNVPIGQCVTHTCNRFLEELKTWNKFVEGLA